MISMEECADRTLEAAADYLDELAGIYIDKNGPEAKTLRAAARHVRMMKSDGPKADEFMSWCEGRGAAVEAVT